MTDEPMRPDGREPGDLICKALEGNPCGAPDCRCPRVPEPDETARELAIEAAARLRAEAAGEDVAAWCRDCGADLDAAEIEHDTCPLCGGKPRYGAKPEAEPEQPPEALLADGLLAFGRAALGRADAIVNPSDRRMTVAADATEARTWAQAAREALEARKLADEPLTEGERAATAVVVKTLRHQLAAADERAERAARQRDRLAAFMGMMAEEFESPPGSDQARRQAGRLRRAVEDVMQQDA